MPSSTVENYLKAVLVRSGDGDAVVTTGVIAEALGVTAGTVTTMVKSMAAQGLLEHQPREGVRLTPAGRDYALAVLRKHRLIEAFLVQVLKMDWAEVHLDAERLEHAVSERVLERIDAFLGHPGIDPHGDPIPSAQGKIDTRAYSTLATSAMHTPLRLVRITDQSPEFLQFAERHGLVPDASLSVTAREEAAGVVSARLKSGRSVNLGVAQAVKLLVEPVKGSAA